MTYSNRWDLECFFQGGSHSEALRKEMERIKEKIASLETMKGSESVPSLLEALQDIDATLGECDAFILCLQSQDTADMRANQLRADYTELEALFHHRVNRFEDFLARMDTSSFQTLVNDPQLALFRFILEEKRKRGSQKLSIDKEDLITTFSIDGYHAWGDLYPMLVQEITIPFEEKGEKRSLSFGQAENQFTHADRKVRKEVFTRLEAAWDNKSSLFASVLNHIAGFRLAVYAERGWNDPLQEPLFENRMSKETLEAMWDAVGQFKKPLTDYLRTKARLLNLSQLSWYDLEAPLSDTAGEFIPFDQGAAQIIAEFARFHPEMGVFAKKACGESWIEAEDRPGKRPGGYCCAFPKSQKSRIFMTYAGSRVNVMTLAHELGHAWHTKMVEDLPRLTQHYRMNVAETASTFAEQIISDALLKEAKTQEQKRAILSGRIERAVTFLMNIHARFLFETRFYQSRKKNFLAAEELCRLMKEAQEEAYCKELMEWHPWFWAAKLHFYFTSVPFYNFPYTFGYLFSLGIYARAQKEGASFADRYNSLLRESGMMSVEDLAQKHLGVDLRRPDFWRESCSVAVADVGEFLALARYTRSDSRIGCQDA